MTDLVTVEMYGGMRARWEEGVARHDYGMWLMGPPSWLVKERQKVGEEFLAAALRVRGETWPGGWKWGRLAYSDSSMCPENASGKSACPESQANKRTRGRPSKWGSEAERKRASRRG